MTDTGKADSNESKSDESTDFLYDTFPDGFKWGVATSSFQIEGGWDADGKGESIWDRFCHEPGHMFTKDTGDVTCDSYHLYNEDIRLLQNLGVHFYRFSLSWPRIIPGGKLSTGINEAGITYYDNLINGLLGAGIEPMVTLYHWDLPQALQDDGGGWLNPDILRHFNDYANVCFQRFGDRVKLWLTINEPRIMTWLGYGIAFFAPGIASPDTGVYTVGHNIIKAHAAAWHTYDRHYRSMQQGKVSIAFDGIWNEPISQEEKDIAAAERAQQFILGWFAHPIFVNGDYPDVMRQLIAAKSLAEGRQQSRLPEFTEDEKKFIAGTFDFFALNHYTAQLVKDVDHQVYDKPTWENDMDAVMSYDPSWPRPAFEMMRVVPWSIRKNLQWVRDNYGDMEIIITENGYSDDTGTLQDDKRIQFHRDYINMLLKAIKLDGCHVVGYAAWSLMDNIEWSFGSRLKFGLHHVDFSDPARRRTAKDSAAFYKQLISDNGWPQDTESRASMMDKK